MWEYLSGKNILITGGSGFLGTTLVHRLVTQAPVAHIYLICRGGWPRLERQWSSILPHASFDAIRNADFITVVSGDILKPNFGLSDEEAKALQEKVDIVVHSASSINLAHPLPRLIDSIIDGTLKVCQFALECDHLSRFVYVSTAYANTHLYHESKDVDVRIDEEIYPANGGCVRGVLEEWRDVKQRGTSDEFEAHEFGWAYAYAKHLTERLLCENFMEEPQKLLILRPSIIGPAQLFPFPGFNIPTSTPTTMFIAAGLIIPSRSLHIPTRSQDPKNESTIDEVPVDVVVDRLLVHLSKGTTGPVHAVSGKRARTSTYQMWKLGNKMRRIPWNLDMKFMELDWHSPRLEPISRFYLVMGLSFDFAEAKTEAVYDGMSEVERRGLQLFTACFGERYDFNPRREEIMSTARKFASKTMLGRCKM